MNEQGHQPQHLPPGLTRTVGVVQEILGRVVADAGGRDLYEVVEGVRREMVAFREAGRASEQVAALDRAAGLMSGLPATEKAAFARAYTLYLELVNVCENAYRTHRLARRRRDAGGRAQLTFVLTAHPTESRSPSNIRLLRRIQDEVVAALEQERSIDGPGVENLLHLAWRAGTHPADRPSVEDEANHLFSLLTDPILSEIVTLSDLGHRIRLRTWVGGDKDGHPGVGPEQTVAALTLSRRRLLEYVEAVLLPPAREDVALSGDEALVAVFETLRAAAAGLRTLGDGDGARVRRLCEAIDGFQDAYADRIGIAHPAAHRLSVLLDVFPGLVVPLELREERGRFGPDTPIADMLRRVAAIARGGPIDAYARALVVSMTREARDLFEAQDLVGHVCEAPALPVIPLFELPDVLDRAPEILDEAWNQTSFRDAVERRGYLEVMLGYSDTAKRMGMLASRVALHDAMRAIGEWAESEEVSLLFFHGHGGSVGRGGGRIEDLAATWPPRARTPYKHTVQGEMVERTFATPEILRSLVEKVAEVQDNPPEYCGIDDLTRELADASAASFAGRVRTGEFRRLLERATPYAHLEALTIGSRPSSRAGGGLEELRAIPWVLCWTQTRLLLHAWLGVGAAWRAAAGEAAAGEAAVEARLAEARASDPLFRSYARLLSFTIAKTEPVLWRRYRQILAPDTAPDLVDGLDAELEAARDLALRARGEDTLLPDRPWLEESIHYRAPMIHPLNLLQVELLAKPDWDEADVRLFRETITGIAAGMLTTG